MSRVKSQCKRCGRCCCVPLTVRLYRIEVERKKFKFINSKNELACIIKRKIIYVPEFKKKRLVCYYYDPNSKDCMVHDDKPKACADFNCQKKPKVWIDIWYDWLKA